MSDSSSPFDAETEEYSISLPEPFVEDLAEQYPRSRSVNEALYTAAEEAVAHRRQEITPEDITDAVISVTEHGAIPVVPQSEESE